MKLTKSQKQNVRLEVCLINLCGNIQLRHEKDLFVQLQVLIPRQRRRIMKTVELYNISAILQSSKPNWF